MLKVSKGRVITLIVIAACIGLGYGIYEAGFDATPSPGAQSTTILGGQAIGNRLSTRAWSFAYDRLTASTDGTYLQAQGVHHGIIYRKGKSNIELSADHVTINLATKDFQINGHVHVEMGLGGKKRSFDTTMATWTQRVGVLSMPGLIHLSDRYSQLDIRGATVDTLSGQTSLGRLDGVLHP